MPTAGELLRDERLRRGRTIAEISEKTCISSRYLEAIETDHLTDLPGEFFHRAFIRQYARALELDPATTDRVLDAAGPTQAPDPVPALNAAYENAQTGADTRPRVPTGLLIFLLIGAILGGSGLYAWWQHVQARQERAAAVPPAVSRNSTPKPRVQTPPDAGESGPSSGTAGEPVAAAPVGSSGQLALSATERVWISVENGDETIFRGILNPGDSRSFELSGTGRMVTGNAGGLTGSYAGKPLGEIGPRGHVRVVRFSGSDFEVQQPQRKSKKQ